MTVWELPRNDLKAAKAFYLENGARLTQDEWLVIWRTQDDPTELEAMADGWNVDDAPAPSILDLLG
jgi:hypothetical protein